MRYVLPSGLVVLALAACIEADPRYQGSTSGETSGSWSGSTSAGTTGGGGSTPGTSTGQTSSSGDGSGATTTPTGTTTGVSTDTTASTVTTTSVDTTSTGASTTTGTSTGASTTTGTSTATTSTATTTFTGCDPTFVEGCDGFDNDCDGLVDEVSADNVACNGCTLAQRNDRAYFFCEISGDWYAARSQCQGLGADLVAIEDQAGNDFVFANVTYDAWIGFTDEAVEAAWVWVDGTAVTFTHWAAGEPNNIAGGEDCGEMRDLGQWNDDRCTDTIAGFVCWAPHTL